MLKNTIFVLSFVILGFSDTSKGGVFADLLCNPTKGGAFGKVPEVRTFVRTFLSQVETSDTLKDLFDLSKTAPKKYADFVEPHTAMVLTKIGVDKNTSMTIGKYAAKAITKLKSLTTRVTSTVIANIAADFLHVDGELKDDNTAGTLAKDLAKTMEERAMKNVKADDPTSKFGAVNNGFDMLFRKDGELIPTKAPILGFFVGTEWFEAAINQCL